MLYDRLKKEYPMYNRLDPEMKKAASEIAEKYPYCTEHVAEISGREEAAGMYKHVNGVYTNDDLSVSKTVRLYPETLEVIEGYRGKNFTEKLRNLVKDFVRQNQENVRQKEGEKGCGGMNQTRF